MWLNPIKALNENLNSLLPVYLQRGAKGKRWHARWDIIMCFYLWKDTDNPFFVWEAYSICHSRGFDAPWWVNDYLAATAKALCSLNPVSGKGEAAQGVYTALGLAQKGSRNPFDRARATRRDLETALKVMGLREKGVPLVGGRRQGAFDAVAAQMAISASTARDAYYKFKPLLEKYPARNVLSNLDKYYSHHSQLSVKTAVA